MLSDSLSNTGQSYDMVAPQPGLDTRSSEVKLMLKWPLNERMTEGPLVPEKLCFTAPASIIDDPLMIVKMSKSTSVSKLSSNTMVSSLSAGLLMSQEHCRFGG